MSQNQDPIHLARQFEIIFTTHYSAVKYFAINLLKSEEDAEDIIQDVFAKYGHNRRSGWKTKT